MRTTAVKQLALFDMSPDMGKWRIDNFSADFVSGDRERKRLESKYLPIMEVSSKFDRQSVSYQLSKNDGIHGWLKYKEGFSAELVGILLNEMGIQSGDTVLDPFLGSGTTALVAKIKGINSIGFDIMPMSSIAVRVKDDIAKYNTDELLDFANFLKNQTRPYDYKDKTPYIRITQGAYPEGTATDIQFFTDTIKKSAFSDETKNLAALGLLNSLESLSYTAKDGQYLRWDERSSKVIETNTRRLDIGKEPLKVIFNKGILPDTKAVLIKEIEKAIADIRAMQDGVEDMSANTTITFKQNSALLELPLLRDQTIHGVITSPPYCNRYDYTRIYALELVYLGLGEEEIKKLRQNLLSCTVENKPKNEHLKEYYRSIGKFSDYEAVFTFIRRNEALHEMLDALKFRNINGDINNSGVINMVKGYFEELTFIYYELFRICKTGARVAFVNDNVRYAGEVIPVDSISTEIASRIGFIPEKIYALRQQKGNSSQQMKKFGRVPLRKSITIWRKP
jgi:site-specific DNA-methyltransferase (cytosine-N4-specific)